MKTPITYYGGKQQMAKTIIGMMPSHKIYCEPFFGGGSVFFAKGKSFLEAINDKNDLIITFYRQCQTNFDELNQKIQGTLCAEAEHKKAKEIWNNPKKYTDIDIAWAVWCSTNMSIMATPIGGWKRDNGTCGSHCGITLDAHRSNFTKAVYERLKHVQISSRDAIKVILERDSTETFFYLDPPYINCNQQHYKGYGEEEFEKLLNVLSSIKGKFILSNFWSDVLSNYIKQNSWNYKVFDRKCMIPAFGSKAVRKQEILVYNYNLELNLFDN